MSPSPGLKVINRKILLTFLVGISLGFIITYTLLTSAAGGGSAGAGRWRPAQQFVPQSPHSHGEMDQFVGPDREQTWNDFHSHNHHGKL